MMEILISFFCIGFCASFIGSLIGLGGGFIIIPSLYLILKVPFKDAVFISLVCVFVVSIFHNLKNRDIIQEHRKVVAPLILFVVLGAIVASLLQSVSAPLVLARSFSILMIGFAVYYLRADKSSQDSLIPHDHPKLWGKVLLFASGGLAGLFGLGGGTVNVPVLNKLQNFEMKLSTQISFFFILASTATALLVQYYARKQEIYQIAFSPVLAILAGVLLGFVLSRRFKLSNRNIKKVFSIILLIIGSWKLLATF